MIIYNVTVNIDDDVHEEWLKWMKEVHIKDVMATGLFFENRICKVLGAEQSSGTTYAVQYSCQSMIEYEQYKANHASRLQKLALEKFSDRFTAFRTLLEIVE